MTRLADRRTPKAAGALGSTGAAHELYVATRDVVAELRLAESAGGAPAK